MNITTFLFRWLRGDFNSEDVSTQIEAGWWDWFCRDSSLKNKTDVLAKKLYAVVKANEKGKRFDPNDCYTFFKNECPMIGSLYDVFKIVDLKTENVLFVVIPKNGHDSRKGAAEVWGRENDFREPLISAGWKDVLNFFEGNS